MAVIINELEVVLEAPGDPAPATAASASPQPSQQIQPLDLTNVREREERAKWRLFAH
jgi:hypothetical protein